MVKNRKPNPKNANLGRSLIKEKNAARRGGGQTTKKDTWLHTSELQDGYDWNRLNLQSVTEQNTLDEFLETAELAGVEFTAEKLNIKIVGAGTVTGVLGDTERAKLKKLQEENKRFLTIPRRPAWDGTTSAEQLALSERDTFLNWRRRLALLQEEKELLLTPYEKNLDVWRQLWRVIERSNVVCQIVDARSPLLYKCDDLEMYVNEVNALKEFIVLVNKADFLTEKQREYWVDYFTEQKTKVIFWSALDETKPDLESMEAGEELSEKLSEMLDIESPAEEKEGEEEIEKPLPSDGKDMGHCLYDKTDNDFKNNLKDNTTDDERTLGQCDCPVLNNYTNTTKLVSRNELIQCFKGFKKLDDNDGRKYITIGLVGYPNVGKSSTINALMQEKKTAVSSTPGKTKHFQTLFIDDDLCLCDCPGLVFPTFISTKADMVLNGILPVDKMKDHVAPSTLLAQLIPRKIIENTYGINIPKPKEGENHDRPPTAEEVLSSYASMRGFMTHHGLPDCPRASRYVLKDFLKGKLLYCHPPPGVSEEDFESCQMSEKVFEKMMAREEKQQRQKQHGKKQSEPKTSIIDQEFFAEKTTGAHYKVPSGSQVVPTADGNEQYIVHKPWKKHNNRNKKEKLRRIYDKS